MRPLFLLMTLAGLLGLAACSTDVELNAPFKERPVVYAALDAASDVQLVRIERSFLTILEPNAYVIAGNKDSLYYPSEALSVTLRTVSKTGVLGTPVALTDTVIAKDTGIFAGGVQVVYRTPPGFKLNHSLYYLVTINHPKLPQPVTAFTTLVTPITRGTSSSDLHELLVPNLITNGQLVFRALAPEVGFKQNLADSVRRFQISLTIPVSEHLSSGDSVVRTVNWLYAIEQAVPTSDAQIRIGYQNTDNRYAFFEQLRLSLDSTDTRVTSRRILPMNLRIVTANNKLANFIEANRGYNVLTQSTPFYTNVSGGLGVVGSRNVADFSTVVDAGFYLVANGATSRYRVFKFQP